MSTADLVSFMAGGALLVLLIGITWLYHPWRQRK